MRCIIFYNHSAFKQNIYDKFATDHNTETNTYETI